VALLFWLMRGRARRVWRECPASVAPHNERVKAGDRRAFPTSRCRKPNLSGPLMPFPFLASSLARR